MLQLNLIKTNSEISSKESNPGIYKISNLNNNKFYIGSSFNPLNRFNHEHVVDLKTNKHPNSYLQNAWNKENNPNIFKFEIIQYCDQDKLIEIEQIWLDKYYDNQVMCYNILPLAGKSHLGAKRSEETKRKQSIASKGIPKSPEHIAAIRKVKQESKGKMVFQYSLDGEFIKEFPAIKEAARQNKMHSVSISRALKNRYATAGGFIWTLNKNLGKELSEAYKMKTKFYVLREVDQYDLCGNFIKTFSNNKEASVVLNLNLSAIAAICVGKTKRKTYGGFIWAFHGREPRLLAKINKQNKKIYKTKNNNKIAQINPSTLDILNIFSSHGEASEITGTNIRGILRCVSGKNKTSGGFIWEYIVNTNNKE